MLKDTTSGSDFCVLVNQDLRWGSGIGGQSRVRKLAPPDYQGNSQKEPLAVGQ